MRDKVRYKVGDVVVVLTSDDFFLWESGVTHEGTVVSVTTGTGIKVRFSKKRFGLWRVYRDVWVRTSHIVGVVKSEAV